MQFTKFATLRTTILFGFVFWATFCILLPQSEGTEGLVAYWPFEEGAGNVALDAVGDHNGQFEGNPTWVEGIVGDWALEVDGDNYVNCGPGVTEDPDMTVAFWMNANSQAHQRPIAVSLDGYYTEPGWMVMLRVDVPPGGVWFRVHGIEGDWNGGDLQINETVYEANTWTHMAFTFDSETHEIKGYIDGELRGTNTAAEDRSVANTEDDCRLGNSGTGENYAGMLDDIQIYNLPLTEDEIPGIMEGPPSAVSQSGKLATTWGIIKK